MTVSVPVAFLAFFDLMTDTVPVASLKILDTKY